MKKLNLIAVIFFALIAIAALFYGIIEKRFGMVCLALIIGSISYVALTDYKKPE